MATIVVTSLSDDLLGNLAGDGQISLREAVEAANLDTSVDGSDAGNGADTIVFQASLAGGTIELAGVQLEISDDLTITGLGADQMTNRGRGDSYTAGRVMFIDASATVVFQVSRFPTEQPFPRPVEAFSIKERSTDAKQFLGSDDVDLFFSGRALRDLLDQLFN